MRGDLSIYGQDLSYLNQQDSMTSHSSSLASEPTRARTFVDRLRSIFVADDYNVDSEMEEEYESENSDNEEHESDDSESEDSSDNEMTDAVYEDKLAMMVSTLPDPDEDMAPLPLASPNKVRQYVGDSHYYILVDGHWTKFPLY
jgi:hypothetical protein